MATPWKRVFSSLRRPSVAIGAAVYVCAAVIYVATAGRAPAAGDWGDFVAAASVLGIAHPTGYPVFLQLLALPLLVLPRAWAAATADVTCALLVAAAPAWLAVWAWRVGGGDEKGGRLGAAVAILVGVFAASVPALWLEATSVEVYGLGLAVFLLVLLLLDVYARSDDGRFHVLAALVTGLAFGVHLSTFIYCGVALAVATLARPRRLARALPAAAALLLGASANLYLPLRASSHTPLKWTWSAINDAHLFVTHVAGRQFSYNLRWPTWLIGRYRLGDLGGALWRNVGPLLILAPVGLWLAWRHSRRAAAAIVAALALNAAFLLAYDIPDLASYRLPALGLAAACAGAAVVRLFASVRRSWLQALAAAVALAAVGVGLAREWPHQRRDPAFITFYSERLATPQGYRSIYVSGDITTNFIFWFRQYTLGQRPDVELYNIDDERFDIEKLTALMWASLGTRPVFADYFFVNQTVPKEAFYRQARPAGFMVEITANETPPGPLPAVEAEVLRRGEAVLRRMPARDDSPVRDREYAAMAWENLGFFHEYRGEAAQAGYYFRKAAALTPDMAVTQSNLARWFWQAGDLAGAKRAALAAAAADPALYTPYAYLTMVAQTEGDLDGALRYARKAVALKPHDGKTHRLLATVYLARGEKEPARRELERMMARKYDDPDAVMWLAQIYREEGRDDEALELLAKTAHRHNDPRVMNAYAMALIERGRYLDAKRELERAARIAPGTPEIEGNLMRLRAMGW